jgi:hypothetical protein
MQQCVEGGGGDIFWGNELSGWVHPIPWQIAGEKGKLLEHHSVATPWIFFLVALVAVLVLQLCSSIYHVFAG